MRRPAFWAGCAVIFGEILGFIIYEQQQSGRIYVGIIALVVGLVFSFIVLKLQICKNQEDNLSVS